MNSKEEMSSSAKEAILPNEETNPCVNLPLSNGRGNQIPLRRMHPPICVICKQTPLEPHAVFCCGAMYCHQCLVDILRAAQSEQVQPRCAACKNVVGDPPRQPTRRAQAATQASTIGGVRTTTSEPLPHEPPAKQLRMFMSAPAMPTAQRIAMNPTLSSRQSIRLPASSAVTPAIIKQPNFILPPSTTGIPFSSNSLPSMGQTIPFSNPPSLNSLEQQGQHRPPQGPAAAPLFSKAPPPPTELNRLIEGRWKSEKAQKELATRYKSQSDGLDDRLPLPPSSLEGPLNTVRQKELKSTLMVNVEKKEMIYPIGPKCEICYHNSQNPMEISCCQKIFCESCISESRRIRNRCPWCSKTITTTTKIEPLTRGIILPKEEENKKEEIPILKEIPAKDQAEFDNLVNKFKDLDEYTLSVVIRELENIRDEKSQMRIFNILETVSNGLTELIKRHKFGIATLNRLIEAAVQDKNFIDGGNSKGAILYNGIYNMIHPPEKGKVNEIGEKPSTLPFAFSKLFESKTFDRNDRLKSHSSAFASHYSEIFHKYTVYSDEEPATISENRITALAEVAEGMTRYGEVTKLASLNYETESNPSVSIISSLEFDRTGNQFAVAGVSRKIKIFDFDHLLDNPNDNHYTKAELKSDSKISNIAWSPANNTGWLASSDYDGHVTLWDVNRGQIVKVFQEHEKRSWSVSFNEQDPNLLASGSDDSKVKIWNINCPRSMAQIEARVNVCCVSFSPTNRNEIVFGSADHSVHLYDIRMTGKPLHVFRGHKKAVSYVKYINSNEIVSASTDSSLRVWNIAEGRCTQELKGHINEKNFVGLSCNEDFVICGSEDSRAYFYYKGLSAPLCKYLVSKEGSEGNQTGEGFVSSVCWKKDSDYALVANSQGKVHLLKVS